VGTEDSGVILIFIYYKCYITVFDKVLCIHLWCFLLFWGHFLIYLLQKVPYFLCKLCLFLFYFLLTTLKYHSNKFLELKPKDEVTLLSPGVLFWLMLYITVFPIHFYGCPFLTQIQD